MKQQIQKIKQHFTNNIDLYIVGSVCIVVSAGVTYYFTRQSGVPEAITNIAPKISNVICWKPTSNQTVEVFIEALGDPGNIIQDITTGTVYASQGQAAKALGVYPSMITRHLQGSIPDVKGHVFEKLGKAMVAESTAA